LDRASGPVGIPVPAVKGRTAFAEGGTSPVDEFSILADAFSRPVSVRLHDRTCLAVEAMTVTAAPLQRAVALDGPCPRLLTARADCAAAFFSCSRRACMASILAKTSSTPFSSAARRAVSSSSTRIPSTSTSTLSAYATETPAGGSGAEGEQASDDWSCGCCWFRPASPLPSASFGRQMETAPRAPPPVILQT
jgi:hypothetical protein